MKKNLVVTVGNDMMGDDGAGPMLARKIERAPLQDWDLLDAGNVPENFLHSVRELGPGRVIIVDAADMGLSPGEIALVDKDGIASLFLMTTHTLPLTYVLEALGEFVPKVGLVGIQPEIVAFGYPVSPRVQQAVNRVYAWLERNGETVEGTGIPTERAEEEASVGVSALGTKEIA